MILPPPSSTRPDTLCPNPTLFRSPPAFRRSRRQPACSLPSVAATPAAPLAAPLLAPGLGRRRRALCLHLRVAVGIEALDRKIARRQIEPQMRSEEHTSELQSLMRISYAVFCLKKKNNKTEI